MSLDDRAADRKTHAQSSGLGAEEWLEDAVPTAVRNSNAAVLHGNYHPLLFINVRLDSQFTGAARDTLHGFRTVQDQIDDHLLKLDAIGEHRGYGRAEFQSQVDLLSNKFALQQSSDFFDKAADVDGH